jgi:hypothetical protein
MKYLCMVYYNEQALDEQALDALSPSERADLSAEAIASTEELRQSGHYVASSPLQSVQTARTLRPQQGKMTITDGPFAETREQLGGFILIEAEDMDEALRLASRMPQARLGCLEVRPVKNYGCGQN